MKLFVGILLLLLPFLGRSQEVYPTTRYTLYQYLTDTELAAANDLFYSQSSWDTPGTATIEKDSYWTATSKGLESAIQDLNMNEDTWDCYVNHYDDYDWSELQLYGLSAPFETLGWNQNTWDNSGSASTDDLDWNQLSSAQQVAADSICYSKETWDGQSLEEWSNTPPPSWSPPTDEPTKAPTKEPTAEPTREPTAAPTKEPTAAPTKETSAAASSKKSKTKEPTAEPTQSPTALPTQSPTVSKAPTTTAPVYNILVHDVVIHLDPSPGAITGAALAAFSGECSVFFAEKLWENGLEVTSCALVDQQPLDDGTLETTVKITAIDRTAGIDGEAFGSLLVQIFDEGSDVFVAGLKSVGDTESQTFFSTVDKAIAPTDGTAPTTAQPADSATQESTSAPATLTQTTDAPTKAPTGTPAPDRSAQSPTSPTTADFSATTLRQSSLSLILTMGIVVLGL